MAVLAPSLSLLSCNSIPDLPIIDTHQHLWDLDLFPLKWIKAPLDRSFLMEDYMDATRGQDLVKAIYMEVGVPPELKKKEADWALELCKDPGNPTVGAVISADPGAEDFESYIRSLAKIPYLKGIRYSFKNPEEFHSAQVIKNIRLLGDLGLSCDLNLSPRNLANGNFLMTECPDTGFILNHSGGADPIAFLSSNKEAPKKARHKKDHWYREIERLAKQNNLICKISGIVDNAGTFPLEAADLAPIIDYCMDSFGPDRVIFASDWPVCIRNMSLSQWIETLKEVVAPRPISHQRKLFHDNAAAFYSV